MFTSGYWEAATNPRVCGWFDRLMNATHTPTPLPPDALEASELCSQDTAGSSIQTRSPHSWKNRLGRLCWSVVWRLLFRPSPRFCHGWRRWLLRCFGARIGSGSHIYPGAIIWAPWNLHTGQVVAIADGAEVYNPERIEIGSYATISQGALLCGASHDYLRWTFPVLARPICIGAHAWIAARAIVHMGISVGEGCVVAAGSVVTRDLPPWHVCAGNPCCPIKPYEKR